MRMNVSVSLSPQLFAFGLTGNQKIGTRKRYSASGCFSGAAPEKAESAMQFFSMP